MSIISDAIARIGVGYGQASMALIGFSTQNKQDGRSGWWRLWLSKIQEEALKKSKSAKLEEVIKQTVEEQPDGTALVYEGERPVKPAPEHNPEPPRQAPKPVVKPPQVLEKEPLMVHLWRITSELRFFQTQLIIQLDSHNQKRAEEDDESISLLLAFA